ncbi:hypothetical protein [Agromyces silvae]|nr:hypothetical protein [Agromyces protaetiae]
MTASELADFYAAALEEWENSGEADLWAGADRPVTAAERAG